MRLSLRINGIAAEVETEADTPLLWILRDQLGLTGTKYGCGAGHCGSCMVLINGRAKRACLVSAAKAAKTSVVTIEGVRGPVADCVLAAWRQNDISECGYCMSGQIISAIALLSELPRPTDAQIDAQMDGNLCRCAAYSGIRRAIRQASDSIGR